MYRRAELDLGSTMSFSTQTKKCVNYCSGSSHFNWSELQKASLQDKELAEDSGITLVDGTPLTPQQLGNDVIFSRQTLHLLPWGCKYCGDLKSELDWIFNGQKEVGLQMVWILNEIWNPFVIWTNVCHFVKNHWKTRQKRPDFEWSGSQMVGSTVGI